MIICIAIFGFILAKTKFGRSIYAIGGNKDVARLAGLNADACVVGLGAYMAKDEFKKEGGSCMKASAYFSADLVGAGSVEVLLDMISGKEPVMKIAVDAIVVTLETYKEVMGAAAE